MPLRWFTGTRQDPAAAQRASAAHQPPCRSRAPAHAAGMQGRTMRKVEARVGGTVMHPAGSLCARRAAAATRPGHEPEARPCCLCYVLCYHM